MKSKKKRPGNGTLNGPRKQEDTASSHDATSGSLTNDEVSNNIKMTSQGNHHSKEGSSGNLCQRPENVFPAMTPWIAMCLILMIRVFYVVDPNNWWVLHPDEVFQSMEVAHSQVYGYGFRPYEFIAPHRGSNLSHYQKRELMLDMNALRSPIVPEIYAMVVAVITWTGWQGNPFLIWRVSHVVLTSTLPLAVYFYVKATGKSHDVASLSSILTAASSHLNVFGTHTLINSFISPILFLSLSRIFFTIRKTLSLNENCCHNNIIDNFESDNKISGERSRLVPSKLHKHKSVNIPSEPKGYVEENGDTNVLFADLMTNKSDHYSAIDRHVSYSKDSGRGESLQSGSESSGHSFDDDDYDEDRDDNKLDNNNDETSRNIADNDKKLKANCNESINDKTKAEDVFYTSHRKKDGWGGGGYNFSIGEEDGDEELKERRGTLSSKLPSSFTRRRKTGKNDRDKREKKIPTENICTYSEKNKMNRHKKLALSPSSSELFPVTKLYNSILSTNYMYDVINFCAGAGVVLCAYVRPDSTLLIGLLALGHAHITQLPRLLAAKSTWILAFGAIFTLILAILEDVRFYQGFMVSPWQWTKFNIMSTMPSRLFGAVGFSFYLGNVFFDNTGASALSFFFIISVYFSIKSLISNIYGRFIKMLHSSKPENSESKSNEDRNNNIKSDIKNGKKNKITHKSKIEFNNDNFIPDSCHVVTVVVMTTIYSFSGHKEERFIHDVIILYLIVTACSLTSLLSTILLKAKNANSIYIKRTIMSLFCIFYSLSQWNAMPTGKQSDVNKCLHFISTQENVTGVFLDSQYPYTFSYSILHKEVPLLTLMQSEYLEFHPDHFKSTHQPCLGRVQEGKPNHCHIRYTSLNSVSNLVFYTNTESLLKIIIDSASYNFAIIETSTPKSPDFFHPAFQTVFQTKSATVWRRTRLPEHEIQLQTVSDAIPEGGRNTTLVEYEAEVLKQLGNYQVAMSKFKVVLSRPEGVKASTISSMAYCLHRMGRERDARSVVASCSQLFDKDSCLSGAEVRVNQLGVV